MKNAVPLTSAFLRNRLDITRKSLCGQRVVLRQLTPVKEELKVPQPGLRTRKVSWWRSIFFVGSLSISVVVLLILFGPALYYTVFPSDPIPLKTSETGTPLGGRFDKGTQAEKRTVTLPPRDESLPEGEWLIIPSIGVKAQIQENANSDEALQKGVWRVPNFGTAGDTTKPMILAAHRYGYLWWWQNGSQYWRYNSFYLLPKVLPGDQIEIIADKRKFTYEVYAGEEGKEISDYNADLILYTCRFLNADARFFRYARLLDLNKNTQLTFAKNQ